MKKLSLKVKKRKQFHSKNLKKLVKSLAIARALCYSIMVLQITALALMQEVATRSVALPRNARRFSCGASLLS